MHTDLDAKEVKKKKKSCTVISLAVVLQAQARLQKKVASLHSQQDGYFLQDRGSEDGGAEKISAHQAEEKSMFSSMFGSTKSTFFVETGEKKPSSGDTTGCGKAPPKGTKAAFTWCRKNNVPYVEPYSDADGDGDPGDYADCLLQHAKFVLANVATHECSVNCANYLNRNEQKAAKERREKENSMKGGFATLMTKIGGIFTNHDPFPDPQFQRCPSALSRRRQKTWCLQTEK